MASFLKRYSPYAVLLFCVISAIYSVLASPLFIYPYQWALVFVLTVLSVSLYLLLDRGDPAGGGTRTWMILFLYASAGAAFYPTWNLIFRNEEWLAYTLFNSLDGLSFQGFKDIAFFEIFGDIRFQPLAHLLLFARHLLFGNNVLLYHLLNILMHVAAGLLIFLILRRLTRETAFSALFGLLFIVLPGQFDLVAWTYHIYMLAGALCLLLSILLMLRFAEKGGGAYMIAAVMLSLSSMFFYEPAIAGPAALFFIFAGSAGERDKALYRRDMALAGASIALAYLAYFAAAAYGMTLTTASQKMSLGDMTTWSNIAGSLKTLAVNLWESTFIKNTGTWPTVLILDVVYAAMPKGVYTDVPSVLKIITALFLVSLFRVTKTNRRVAASLAALAVSYLFVISLGRMITNNTYYVVTQPRYQYLPNALLLLTAGLLLAPKYREKGVKPIIAVILFTMLFLNIQGVLDGNNRVAYAMNPMTTHYQRIKGFFRSNPSSRLFVSFVPDDIFFTIGKDMALKVMFEDRVTVFGDRATHVYDGRAFRENAAYRGASRAPYLENFTIEWTQWYSKNLAQLRDTRERVIIGSGKRLPMISLERGGRVKVAVSDAYTGRVDTYSLLLRSLNLKSDDIAVEKAGNMLCLYLNGKLHDTTGLRSVYKGWTSDNIDLLGGYYKSYGKGLTIGKLYMQLGYAKYGCRER